MPSHIELQLTAEQMDKFLSKFNNSDVKSNNYIEALPREKITLHLGDCYAYNVTKDELLATGDEGVKILYSSKKWILQSDLMSIFQNSLVTNDQVLKQEIERVQEEEKKYKFCIGIPTINRVDLLFPALLYYTQQDFANTEIFIIDNGNQNWNDKSVVTSNSNIHLEIRGSNLGVAASWNRLCELAWDKGYTHILMMNDDVCLGYDEAEINNLIHNFPYTFWHSKTGYTCFMLPKSVWDKVGRFDEEFIGAYAEDLDYSYRNKLNNVEEHETFMLTPKLFRSSMSVSKDKSLNKNYERNIKYYCDKWGCPDVLNPFGLETFTTPFNK
jgi:hypothetical protein